MSMLVYTSIITINYIEYITITVQVSLLPIRVYIIITSVQVSLVPGVHTWYMLVYALFCYYVALVLIDQPLGRNIISYLVCMLILLYP